MKRFAWILFLIGCYADREVVVDEAIALQLCPDDHGGESANCSAIADGATAIPMRACTLAKQRPVSLDGVISVPSGHWAGTTERTMTFSLAVDPCARVALIPPGQPGNLAIDLDVAGLRLRREITLAATALAGVTLEPAPAVLSADTNVIRVTARVAGRGGGRPSSGTWARFAITRVAPATAVARFQSELAQADADGTAIGTMVVSAAVQSVDIEVTATPPETATPPDSVKAMLTLSVL